MARNFWVMTNRSAAISSAVYGIESYKTHVQDNIKKALRESTMSVYKAARDRVPERTGLLKKSITMRLSTSGLSGVVEAKSRYGHLVEFGAGPALIEPKKAKALHIKGKFYSNAFIPERKPHPFMKPAAEQEKGKLEARITEAIKNG